MSRHQSTFSPSSFTFLLLLCLVLAGSRTPALAQQPAPPDAGANTVVFTSGETLSGELVKADSAGITFKSSMIGEFKVKWANVKELRSGKPFAVIAKNQKLTRGDAETLVPRGAITADAANVTVLAPEGPKLVPTATIDQVVEAASFDKTVLHPPDFFHGWEGAATAGASLIRATQNATTFNGSINLVRAAPAVDWLPARNRTLLDYNQSYGSTSQALSPVVKTNIFHAGLERDEYFSARLYAFGSAAFDHNFSQGLDLQQQYGGGIGYTVLKSEAQQFDVKADLHYERQQFFAPGTSLSLFGSTFGETYHRTLPRALIFDEFATLSEAWNNTNAYSARAGATLTFPVYRGFAFNVGATDEYLNNAPIDFKKNSVTFTSGIAYTFKH